MDIVDKAALMVCRRHASAAKTIGVFVCSLTRLKEVFGGAKWVNNYWIVITCSSEKAYKSSIKFITYNGEHLLLLYVATYTHKMCDCYIIEHYLV